MAEEVEITNVGGDNGVASEATLNMLLESFDKMAKGQGTEARKAKEAAKKYHEEMKNGIEIIKDEKESREDNTDALDDNTRSLNMFRSGLGVLVTGISGLIGGVSNFAEELAFGGDRLSDFAQHVPLVGGYLSILTGIVDESIDTFRELSQVGATFSGGLTEFRRLAGEAAMPLDEFGRLVQENSESLKLFGKDTAMGARNFAAMSNEFRRGVGKELLNLGFTSSELNDTLMDFAEIQAMIFGAERAQSMITTQNAGEFAHQLQRLSAITGKRRDQIAEEMMQTASDARARVAIANMDKDARKRFQANLALAPESLKETLIDMADGIPNNEVTQRLMAFSDTFRDQAGNIKNMTQSEMTNFAVAVRDELQQFSEEMPEGQFQGLMDGLSGFAEAMGTATDLSNVRAMSEEEIVKLNEKLKKEANREDAILQFAETLNTIRGNLQVAFVESGLLQVVEDLATKFTDFLSNPKTIDGLESALESVSAFLNKFITDIDEVGFKQALLNILYDISDAFLDFFLGPNTKMTGHPGIDQKEIDIEREGGFWQEMLKPLMGQAVDTIVEGVSAWWSESSLITKAMVIGAGALFVAGGPIASAFVSGITTLFASRAVKNAVSSTASSLFSMKTLKGLGKLLKIGASLPFLAATLAVTPSELGDGTVTGNVDRQMADEGLTPENMGDEEWHKEREKRINDFLENVGDASDVNDEYLRSLSERIAAEQDKINRSKEGENVYWGRDSKGREESKEKIARLIDQIRHYEAQLEETADNNKDDTNSESATVKSPQIENTMSELSTALQNITESSNRATTEGMQELNTTMAEVLTVLRQAKTIEERIEKNTSSIGGNIANGRVSNIR